MHRLGCPEAKGETALYAKIEQLQADYNKLELTWNEAIKHNDKLQKESEDLKAVVINVADDLRYLTQKGRNGVPDWIINRVLHCVTTIDKALNQGNNKSNNQTTNKSQ